MWWRQRIHPHWADEGNKILLTTKRGGVRGNRRGAGTWKWSESGYKPTEPLIVTSERQALHGETNNVVSEVGGESLGTIN